MPINENAEQRTSMVTSISTLLKTALGLGADLLKIALLESQVASKSLVSILGVCLGIGLLVFTLWLLLQAALIGLLINFGLGWPLAILSVIGINVLVVIIMACMLRRYCKRLSFSTTRKQLQKLSEQV